MNLDEALALCAAMTKKHRGQDNSYFGFVSSETPEHKFAGQICVAGLWSCRPKSMKKFFFFMRYNGCGVDAEGKLTTKHRDQQQQDNAPALKHYNEFSCRWVDFLIGPLSPWRCIMNRLVSPPEFCYETGFLFKDAESIPYRLIYTFCQATRFAWEHPGKYKKWMDYVDSGIDPRMAVLLAVGFKDGALTYTHHFTLDSDIRVFAYRWLNSDPVVDTGTFTEGKSKGFNFVFRTDEETFNGGCELNWGSVPKSVERNNYGDTASQMAMLHSTAAEQAKTIGATHAQA
jgi:hypothetical protein